MTLVRCEKRPHNRSWAEVATGGTILREVGFSTIRPQSPLESQMTSGERSARSGSTRTDRPAPSALAPQRGLFRKEGEFWTVGYDACTFRLKDSKGLGYLAHLLRHPSAEFHVLDLVGGFASQRDQDESDQEARGLPRGNEDLERAGIHVASLGDAGAMLDEQAKVAYRRRLSDLREELEEAKEQGSVERAERAEAEIDALTRELSRAVGLGGRSRRAASAFRTSPTDGHQDYQGCA
jgi:hypothetical protein